MAASNQDTQAAGSSPCCAAAREPTLAPAIAAPEVAPGQGTPPSTLGTDTMVQLPGGQFLMGADDREGYPADGEGPMRKIRSGPSGWTAPPSPTGSSRSSSRRPATSDRGRALRLVVRLRRAAARPTFRPPAPWRRRPGGGRSTAPTGGTPKGRTRRLTAAPTIPWSRSPGTTPARTQVGRQAPPHRGRVGVRRARRPGAAALPLGRRAHARWRAPHERLAGHVPDEQHPRGRLPRHGARGRLRAQRLRPATI